MGVFLSHGSRNPSKSLSSAMSRLCAGEAESLRAQLILTGDHQAPWDQGEPRLLSAQGRHSSDRSGAYCRARP